MPVTKEYSVDTSKPVLVTGATGYIAGVLIQKLLQQGLTVHATARSTQPDKVKFLTDMANQEEKGTLKLFEADLLQPGSFAEAMKGCAIVFHTASPFNVSTKLNPKNDLIDPAVKGVENVLEQANQTSSVKRVIYTSSSGAVHADAADCFDAPNGTLTEEQWNTTASLSHQPYYYAKTLAEQKAWEIHRNQSQWTMAVMIPTLVQGPGLKYYPSSQSNQLFSNFANGEWKGGAPNLPMAVVDIRDVAEAHLASAYLPEEEQFESRVILSGTNASFPAMAQVLHAQFGKQYPKLIPQGSMKVPKFMIWLLAPYLDDTLTRKNVARNYNYSLNVDNSKSKKVLGMEYISLEQTMKDMFEFFVAQGVFPSPTPVEQ
mmetsp:Transcript_6841/g.13924  ORF Transcript_6841/g.13924 Transcript_6841/m.13924 type:complete len:373 (-) Transcript_6841:141-1259(-)|eukprot:CAMPEP_0168764358 /NCGR_PEP_ID=MMETSP0724-20121128/24832_1 /TAXON_ID=265536 /ORGANISM="Amphiprora sp., Strain CCMP467" /LENGTH=372 /DNA_ID=CAMNT_0008813579 /DNA_START=62 /DNA_END=1180 /DNA_ORIENTATION=-